jgi:hypothetical protein
MCTNNYHANRPHTRLVHELGCKQTTRNNKDVSYIKSLRYDDKDCRTMNLMRERTSDTYRVQE